MEKTTPCTFTYLGKEHTGYIIASTDMQPFFYWFIFDHPEELMMAGDSIAFQLEDGALTPVHTVTGSCELVTIIQQLVEDALGVTNKQLLSLAH